MINESLRRFPLFADLSEADMEWLSAHVELMAVAAGTNLIEEGQPGDAAYLVVDGEFEVVKKSDRQSITIALREAGEVFGEMALIDQVPRTATATAKTACKLAVIPEKRFLFMVQTTPHFALKIMKVMADRLRKMNQRV